MVRELAEVHPSASRLLEAATAATRDEPLDKRVTTFASLGRRMSQSAQTMTNWKQRGVSVDGAVMAERLFGCSVNWVLDGWTPKARPATHEDEAQLLRAFRSLPPGSEHRRKTVDYAKDQARLGELRAEQAEPAQPGSAAA